MTFPLFILATILAAPVADDPTEQLKALSFLEGHWKGRSGRNTAEATYTGPAGGMVLAATKEISPAGRAVFFDWERMHVRDGKVVLTPHPFGKKSKDFPLKSLDAKGKKAVFENLEHDFPKRFTYQRKGDKLVITLWGEQGGKEMTAGYEFSLKR